MLWVIALIIPIIFIMPYFAAGAVSEVDATNAASTVRAASATVRLIFKKFPLDNYYISVKSSNFTPKYAFLLRRWL